MTDARRMPRMRGVSILVLSTLVLTGGCFSTVTVHKPVSQLEAEQLTRAAAGRSVKIETVANDRPAALSQLGQRGLDVHDPNALVVTRGSGPPTRIPFEEIHTVVVKDRGKGGLEGFLIGAVPGAIAGMVVGSALDGAGCGEDGSGMRSSCSSGATVTMALGGALLTGLIGAVVGAAIGHRTTFAFADN